MNGTKPCENCGKLNAIGGGGAFSASLVACISWRTVERAKGAFMKG
jgi:hypothetical protein